MTVITDKRARLIVMTVIADYNYSRADCHV